MIAAERAERLSSGIVTSSLVRALLLVVPVAAACQPAATPPPTPRVMGACTVTSADRVGLPPAPPSGPPAPSASAATAMLDTRPPPQRPAPKPRDGAPEPLVVEQGVVVVVIAGDGRVLLSGEEMVDDGAIVAFAKAARAKDPEVRARIDADQGVKYGRVVQIMDLLMQGGVKKIAFGVSRAGP